MLTSKMWRPTKIMKKRTNGARRQFPRPAEICDSVEMFEKDISLAIATYGRMYYEICTTHGRHNLYLIESMFDDENRPETIDVFNVSDEIGKMEMWAEVDSFHCIVKDRVPLTMLL